MEEPERGTLVIIGRSAYIVVGVSDQNVSLEKINDERILDKLN